MTWLEAKAVAAEILADLRRQYSPEDIRLILRALSRLFHSDQVAREPGPTSPPNDSLSAAKRRALEAAQQAQREAVAQARRGRIVPEGFRSLEHFLDSVAEVANRVYGGQADLARYVGSNTKSVSRWLRREKIPRQQTLDAMHRWYLSTKR